MIMCSVFRSPKREGLYLYVPKKTLMEDVPDVLLEKFGKPQHAMDLLLRKDKPLAVADVEKVMTELDAKGFYLQLPPVKDNYLLDLHNPSD